MASPLNVKDLEQLATQVEPRADGTPDMAPAQMVQLLRRLIVATRQTCALPEPIQARLEAHPLTRIV